jgi:hypothetical protein
MQDRKRELTAHQIRDHTYPLLRPIAGLDPDDRARTTYARRHGDDLVELLAHRDDHGLQRLTDDDVARVGAAELYSLARERLRLVPTEGCDVVRPDRGQFRVLRGASELTASKLVLLPEVLRPVLGAAVDAPAGIMVSVPTQHELAFAPVGGDLPAVLTYLARYTVMTFQDGRDPLSPTTYWWHAGELTPMVTLDAAGMVDFRLPPAFMDAIGPGLLGQVG